MQGNTEFAVNISPNKSQVLLVVMLLGGCGICALGIYFLWHEKSTAWIPITIGCCMIAFSSYAWLRSHKDTDLNSSSTVLENANTGIKIITDSRVANSPEVLSTICKAIESSMVRQPLPVPSGLIDSDGVPIADSKETAINQVEEINNTAQRFANEIGEKFEIAPQDSVTSLNQVKGQLPSDVILDLDIMSTNEIAS